MFRRQVCVAAAAVFTALVTAGCSKAMPTHITISVEQIQAALQTRFPQRFPVAGLLLLQMQLPQLQMLAGSNQVQAQLQVQLSGSALPQTFTGHMDVRFGLRYDASNRSIRAERVAVDDLVLLGAAAAIADMVSTYGLRLAEQALDDLPLYVLTESDLAVANALALQPGAITVTHQGLTIAIDRKHAHRTTPQTQ